MFKINEKLYYLPSHTNKDDLYFSSVLFKGIKSYDSEKFMAHISFFTSMVSANSPIKNGIHRSEQNSNIGEP